MSFLPHIFTWWKNFKSENVKGSYFYFLPYISLKKKNRGSGLYFLLSYFFEKILKKETKILDPPHLLGKYPKRNKTYHERKPVPGPLGISFDLLKKKKQKNKNKNLEPLNFSREKIQKKEQKWEDTRKLEPFPPPSVGLPTAHVATQASQDQHSQIQEVSFLFLGVLEFWYAFKHVQQQYIFVYLIAQYSCYH